MVLSVPSASSIRLSDGQSCSTQLRTNGSCAFEKPSTGFQCLRKPLGTASWDERYGTALHELGHALGFSSHVAHGGSVMTRSPAVVRRVGAELQAGDWSGDATLRALYSVPSGTVVGTRALPAEIAGLMKRFWTGVENLGLEGPFTRVGDQGSRIFYRGAAGETFAVSIRPWPPSEDVPLLQWVLNARAQRLMGPARPHE